MTTISVDSPANAGNQHKCTEHQYDKLKHCIEHASHLLPAQGPISVFIHHNTLHAFEDLSFYDAVQKGSEVFGCEPYLKEQQYRDALSKGRIRISELQKVLRKELRYKSGQIVFGTTTFYDLRLAMLQCPLWTGSSDELHWLMAETDALNCVRPEVSTILRRRLLAETRHWVMRDLRARSLQNNGNGHASSTQTNGTPGWLQK
jgi:uncharacterized protein